jgi:hypothetical protein
MFATGLNSVDWRAIVFRNLDSWNLGRHVYQSSKSSLLDDIALAIVLLSLSNNFTCNFFSHDLYTSMYSWNSLKGLEANSL